MSEIEQLRCNICGFAVTSGEAKDHASSTAHSSLRKKLEKELDAIKDEEYSGDSSVILRWKSSV